MKYAILNTYYILHVYLVKTMYLLPNVTQTKHVLKAKLKQE